MGQLFAQQLVVDGEDDVHNPLLIFDRKFLVEPEVADGDVGQRLHHFGAV